MTSWKELKTERKSIMSFVELAIILMGLTLLSVIFLGYKALNSNNLIHRAESALRMAGDQLEDYRLGSTAQIEATFQMLNIKSLSPLPGGNSWDNTRKVLDEAQASLTGLVQSNKNYLDLKAKADAAFNIFEAEAKDMISKNKAAATAQDVLLAAQSIRDWMAKTPTDIDLHQIESAYMTEKIKIADAALETTEQNPTLLNLKKTYDGWMEAVNEQLLEENAFADQKKLAKIQLTGVAINIEKGAASWVRKTRLFAQGFIGLFALLIGVIFFNLQALKKNPHLNTMFSSKGTEALQAELEAVTSQVDQILSNVDKAWMDSRAELKVVHHAIEDSEVLESQVQQLKSDMGTVISSMSKSLQELEHQLRKTNATDADRIATLLAEVQTSGSRIHQSLDVLAESGYSIHDELQQVRKNIKRLMSETLNLKKEGETLEESSEAISTSV